jgi:hypothetical protein
MYRRTTPTSTKLTIGDPAIDERSEVGWSAYGALRLADLQP